MEIQLILADMGSYTQVQTRINNKYNEKKKYKAYAHKQSYYSPISLHV